MTNETAGGSIAEFVQARSCHWIQPLPFAEARIMAAELLKLDGRCMSLIERLATLEAERDAARDDAHDWRAIAEHPCDMHPPALSADERRFSWEDAAAQERDDDDGE